MFMLTTTGSLRASELCFPYGSADLNTLGMLPTQLRLFNHQDRHGVNGWIDITTRLDTAQQQVCGRVSHSDLGRAFAFGGPGVSTPRFLAEGATSTMFDTQIAVLNPHYTPTVAALSFLKSDGTTTTVQRTIPARTRVTVTPKVDAGLNPAEFSTRVDADRELVVDRTIAWDAATGYGAHAEAAVVAPSPMWYLAEGATSDTLNLFYLLQNPNATAVPVRVRYLRPSGSPLEKTYQLAPTSRTNIWVNVETFPGLGTALARTDVSAVIDTLDGQSIIVERALYLDRPGQIFAAGHESAGVTAPALQWFLAEGATGSFFDLFVLIANPGPTDAAIEATYLLPDGTTITKPYTVAANSRFNIWVDFEDTRLADTAVSTTIRSTNGVAVIVERALWWPSGGWYEAHNSPGSTVTGTAWAVAEGEVGGPRQMSTYLLVANTSAKAATVRVTLLYEGGDIPDDPYGTTARTLNVLPNSRFNVDVDAEFPWARGRRFGAIVESEGTDPAQIVVERAMYWDAEGRSWAAGTNALATRMACISPLPGLVCDGDPVIDSCGRDQGVVGKRKGCCSNICDVAEDCTAYGVPENWACTSRSAHCGEPKVACMKDASGCKQCAIVGWCPGCYDVLMPSRVVVKPDWLK